MLTKTIWEDLVFDSYYGEKDLSTISLALMLSILTLVIDIVFLPLELIALIIYFIINRRNK